MPRSRGGKGPGDRACIPVICLAPPPSTLCVNGTNAQQPRITRLVVRQRRRRRGEGGGEWGGGGGGREEGRGHGLGLLEVEDELANDGDRLLRLHVVVQQLRQRRVRVQTRARGRGWRHGLDGDANRMEMEWIYCAELGGKSSKTLIFLVGVHVKNI